MSTVSALPSDIVHWLSAQDALSNITFLTEFPAVKKAIPLKKVIVAVGLESVTLEDKYVDDGNGILVKQEYCRSAQLRITLAIHVPFSLGGKTCHEVFSNVVDALSFASDLNIEESGCGNITSDRDTDALVLKGFLRIAADFCPAASSDMHFQSFLDKELLCGTHIRNDALHVSAGDRERWNNPITVSSYTGTGHSTNTISLGFMPSYAAVFAAEYPCAEYNAGTGKTDIYAAYAVPGGGSVGLQIHSKGFTVLNNSPDFGSCVPYLNKAGIQYYYFVLK